MNLERNLRFEGLGDNSDIPCQGISRPGHTGLSAVEVRQFLNVRQIEDLVRTGKVTDGEWNPSGYPNEYVNGFKIPDEVVVLRLLKHLSPDVKIIGVTLETDKNGTLVHVNRQGSLTQVNWANPEKMPCDYQNEGYARTFWNFYGPNNIQSRRAHMLAQNLNVDLMAGNDEDMIEFCGFGLKVARPETGWFARAR